MCAICHGAIDYHPYQQWEGSMMANAARDDWGKRLYDLWEQTGKSKPVLMATTSKSLVIRSPE